MLLRFSVENWMSFKDEITLSMLATQERQHSEHIARSTRYNLRLLPVAVVYGGNASGKSNLVKALRFAQKFITDPPKADNAIHVKPFRLAKESQEQPTKFRFEILIGETIFEYSFAVTTKKVVREELKRLGHTTEETLFKRVNGKFHLSTRFPEKSAFHFAFQGTQDNQLYLTNSVSQKQDEFKPVFDWFDFTLVVVYPDSHYGALPDITSKHHSHFKRMTKRLRDLDSGIYTLNQIDISADSIPRDLLNEVADDLDNEKTLGLNLAGDEYVFLRKDKGKVLARRLASIHLAEDGTEFLFGLGEESDGTRRLLDLLPAFLFLEEKRQPRVFVIDELDRSLHSLLIENLLQHYLMQCANTSRSQLIFTTHNLQLMDQDIFRRDEIWITERDRSGASKLIGFSEYKDVRKDKDIRKSYIQGRMGGIPRLQNSSVICEEESAE